MKLVFLGTAGYHPSDQRQTTCLMLPEIGVALDAGTAVYRIRDHLVTDTLDFFLSHAHLDHVVGLTFLLDVLAGRSMRSVRVHGEADKLASIREHLFAPVLFPVKPPFESVPLQKETRLVDGGLVTHCPLQHPGGSVGYRIDWPDRSVAYITDTTAAKDAAYTDFIRGVDLLIHECNFPDSNQQQAKLTGHSFTTPVATLAKAASVGRLILAHMNPMTTDSDPIGLDTAQKIFAKTSIAHDNLEVEF